jgi:hypothetical protein
MKWSGHSHSETQIQLAGTMKNHLILDMIAGLLARIWIFCLLHVSWAFDCCDNLLDRTLYTSVTITGAGIDTEIFQVMVYRFRINNSRQVKLNETNGVTLAMQREYTPYLSYLLQVWEEAWRGLYFPTDPGSFKASKLVWIDRKNNERKHRPQFNFDAQYCIHLQLLAVLLVGLSLLSSLWRICFISGISWCSCFKAYSLWIIKAMYNAIASLGILLFAFAPRRHTLSLNIITS